MGAVKGHGIETLSVFAFSSENWERSASEVRTLLGLFASSLEQYSRTFVEQGIALRVVGRRDRFGEALVRLIEDIEVRTRGGANTLIVAADYGGRWDLAAAARRLARRIEGGRLRAADLDEAALGDALSTAGLPDPDLLIRTGAEQRLSNFMLWQTAYTELFFADCWWPDFDERWLERAIRDYRGPPAAVWQMTQTALRIATAAALVALLALGLHFQLMHWLALLGILCGAAEWARLAGVGRLAAGVYALALAAGLAGLPPRLLLPLSLAVLPLWALAVPLLWSYGGRQRPWPRPLMLALGAPLLWPCGLAVGWLDGAQLLPLLALVATADISAWFCGRRWGRVRLARHISPGKTVEGFAGSLVAAAVLAAGLAASGLVAQSWLSLHIAALAAALAAALGDLFLSMMKRRNGAKDSGTILPGHGGVLDRIDGLLAAAPLYVVLQLPGG